MCVVCVTVASTLVVASQISPIQVLSDFTSSQKTLASFSGKSTNLTTKQKSEIKSLVVNSPAAETIVCTGIYLKNSSKATITISRNRAKSACAYANRLGPQLESKVVTKATGVKSSAGKVILSIRTPKEVASAPIATPAPVVRNPFSEPFPEVFSRSELVKAALDNFQKYVSANTSSKSYELVIDASYSNRATQVTRLVDISYAALPFPSDYQKTITVISSDRSFTEQKITEFGFPRTDVNRCINCAGEGWASASIGGPWSVVPHEIFHVWQKSAYKRKGNNNPDPNNSSNPPVWLDEGGAEFFGWATEYLLYLNRPDAYPRISGYSYGWLALTSYNTRDIDNNGTYVVGRAATEYIVASVGYEKYLQIFSNVGNGQSFPDAFASAVGISLSAFYEKFDRLQANIRN